MIDVHEISDDDYGDYVVNRALLLTNIGRAVTEYLQFMDGFSRDMVEDSFIKDCREFKMMADDVIHDFRKDYQNWLSREL